MPDKFYYDEHIAYIGDTLTVDIHPHRKVMKIEIGLEHVRAADNIRVSYDFERDGYVIEQSRWTDENQTGDLWQEVAFIQAWALDECKDDE